MSFGTWRSPNKNNNKLIMENRTDLFHNKPNVMMMQPNTPNNMNSKPLFGQSPIFHRNNTRIVSGIIPKYPPLREEYSAQDCGRKYSNISINSASQVSPSPFGRVIPENPYVHSPNKRRPYAYAELNNSGKSESNFSGFSKTASSFQVPLGSQKEVSDSGNDGFFHFV